MKLTILSLLGLISFNLMAASTPSQSMEQFCADRSSLSSVKELLSSSSNLMAFRNQGGMANGGVCWWHSRFQRNATYLTIYRPAEQRPSKDEAAKIIDKIRSGKDIVVIPGYRNFGEFSAYHADQIQKELEKWQKADGIGRFNWVIGLAGKNIVEASELKEMMDELYDYVEVQGNIAYQKLQIKGITAHAWLVVNMKKVGNGYDLEVLDSNFPSRTSMYSYREGQTHFNHFHYGEFTPYLERKGELDRVILAVLKECDPAEYKKRSREVANNNDYNN